MAVLPRQLYGDNICVDNYGRQYYCQSAWNSWGRWVALAVIIVAAFLFFFLLSCLSARRRKRLGRQPYYGTGWVGRTPFGHGTAQYNPNVQSEQPQYGNGNNQSYNSPPAYGQQQGGYYGQNQSYYGGQETGTELQPPQNAYRGGDNVYQPPSGAPPVKK